MMASKLLAGVKKAGGEQPSPAVCPNNHVVARMIRISNVDMASAYTGFDHMQMSHDGQYVCIIGTPVSGVVNTISCHNLTVAYDITSIVMAPTNSYVFTEATNVTGIKGFALNLAGTKIILCISDPLGDTYYQEYSLTGISNLSSMTFIQDYLDNFSRGQISVSTDGLHIFSHGVTSLKDEAAQIDVTNPWTLDGITGVPYYLIKEGNCKSTVIDPCGENMYFNNSALRGYYQYKLNSPNDITDGILNTNPYSEKKFNLGFVSAVFTCMAPNGLYLYNRMSDALLIYQWELHE